MNLALTLDTNAGLPLHRQLYEELRQAILSGRLLPGQRIPSTRELSKSLGISRSTVTQTYEQLLSEGYLQTIVGSGTFVCTQLPNDLLHSTPVASSQKIARSPIKLSKYAMGFLETGLPEITQPDAPISFRYGRPAFDHFPMKLWRKLLFRHCRASFNWLDYATNPLGYQPLREAIARYLFRFRAMQCHSEQILLTNGTQQALYLVTRLFIDPRDAIAIEDPGSLSARQIFLSQGAKLLPLAVDESGLVVKNLGNYPTETIKLVYVTPFHQFPTGAILSLSRRLELLAWAQQTGALIIEDDYDSEYSYDERPVSSLQGLDQTHSVLYIGSFSKVLFPSLRIGYIVLPPNLVSLFTRAKWVSDCQLPLLEQQVLTDFIEKGHLKSHIRKMQTLYEQRRQALVQACNTYFGERAKILGEKAGIHLMIRLHTHLRDEEIIYRAAQVGVGIISAQPYYLKANSTGKFIFGYSELTEQQLQEGIRRLANVLLE